MEDHKIQAIERMILTQDPKFLSALKDFVWFHDFILTCRVIRGEPVAHRGSSVYYNGSMDGFSISLDIRLKNEVEEIRLQNYDRFLSDDDTIHFSVFRREFSNYVYSVHNSVHKFVIDSLGEKFLNVQAEVQNAMKESEKFYGVAIEKKKKAIEKNKKRLHHKLQTFFSNAKSFQNVKPESFMDILRNASHSDVKRLSSFMKANSIEIDFMDEDDTEISQLNSITRDVIIS